MASSEALEWRPRPRDEQLRRVMERGRLLRARRQLATLVVGLVVATILPVGTLAVLDGDDARVRTLPADESHTEVPDGPVSETPTADIEASVGGYVGTGAARTSGATTAAGGLAGGRSEGLGGPGRAPGETGGSSAGGHDGDGHDHVHDQGCNVVGAPFTVGSVGSEEEDYAAAGRCEYWPSSPGGYVATGDAWQLEITRGERVIHVNASNGRPCEPRGFFEPGDKVVVTARPGSSIAAGARYGC